MSEHESESDLLEVEGCNQRQVSRNFRVKEAHSVWGATLDAMQHQVASKRRSSARSTFKCSQ